MKRNLFFFLLFLAGSMSAQTPFYTEDFANGIPAGWTNEDASGQNALWSWCSDPTSDNGEPGCSGVWGDNTNQQIPFQATTATNGFMTMDSDNFGNLPQDHVSQLTTTAFDFSGKQQIFLKFQNHLGTYTYDADDKAIIRVSTDLVNWTSYQVFNGLDVQKRWSANPEIAILDITPTAASQSSVYIQWQWTGNWDYMWDFDDLEIYDVNPTPRHNLVLGDIFFPASSYIQPASEIQTDTFGFYAYVSNEGLIAQTNVQLKAWVTDATGAVLYADSTTIAALQPGYKDSLIALPGLYAPEVQAGTYGIHYAVSADSTDARPNDNLRETSFIASASSFAKEDNPEQYFRPGTLTDPWYVMNYYRMSKTGLENYKAISIDFAHTSDDTEVAINEVQAGLYLLRLNDDIDDNLSNLDDADFFNSFEWLGIGEYIAADTAQDDGSIRTSELLDFNSGEEGVSLEPGGRYMIAISYAGTNRYVFHAYNNDNKYFFTSTLQYGGGNFYTFGEDVNAVLRLNLSLLSTTDEQPLADAAMEIFPNPATDLVNLKLNLDHAGPATVTIADLSGRVILSQDYNTVQQDILSFPLPKMAAGMYLARIATKEGTLTKKFTVVK